MSFRAQRGMTDLLVRRSLRQPRQHRILFGAHARVVAIHRLRAKKADEGVAVHAARSGFAVAQVPVQQRIRSEERRIGKECDSTCSTLRSPYHKKKHKQKTN